MYECKDILRKQIKLDALSLELLKQDFLVFFLSCLLAQNNSEFSINSVSTVFSEDYFTMHFKMSYIQVINMMS